MNTLNSEDFKFFNERFKNLEKESLILNKKQSIELKHLRDTKIKQLEALETIFNYLNDITQNETLSQSSLHDIYDDEKQLLKELEKIKNFLSKT